MNIQAALIASTGVLAGVLLKGTLLLIVAGLLIYGFHRRTSAACRHAVWCLAFAGLLLLPLAAVFGPRLTVPVWPVLSAARPAPAAPESEGDPGIPGAVLLPRLAEPQVAAGVNADAGGNAAPRNTGVTIDAPSTDRAPVRPSAPRRTSAPIESSAPIRLSTLRPSLTGTTAPTGKASFAPLAALLLIWGIGTAILLVRLASGLVCTALLIRRAQALGDPSWGKLSDRISRQLGLRRSVPLRSHPAVEMPMTCGIGRPVILLPAGAATWPEPKRRLVLMHELAHVRRADVLKQLVMELARALHWPNPLAWIGAHRFLMEREHACDDCVLNAGARPSEYADELVNAARQLRSGGSGLGTAPAMIRRGELKSRVLSILDAHCPRGALARKDAIRMAVLALTIALPIAVLRPASAQDDNPAPTRNQLPAASVNPGPESGSAREEARKQTNAQTELQKQAVFALSRLPRAQSVPNLISIAEANENPAVREQALFWLGQIGGPDASAFLSRFIDSSAPLELREKALFAISRLPKDQAVPQLIKVAQSSGSPELRKKAIFWLGQSGDPRAADTLMSIIRGK